MTIRRKIVPLLLLALALALSGCQGKAKKEPGMPTPEVTPAPTKDIEIITPAVTETPEDETGVTVIEAAEITDEPEITEPVIEEDPAIVVVLDPGHGGRFTGAQYYGKYEKEITLKIAEYIREYLTSNYKNIEVYLTRETDIALDDDIKIELEKRAIFAEEKNADYFVSLHLNASENHNLRGGTVYCSRRDNVHDASYGLAQSILKELVALGIKNNGVQMRKSADNIDENGEPLDYYAVIRHNANRDIPAVIVEHCFMDNETDHAFLDSDEKICALAEADAKGIASYLELELKEDAE